MKEKADIKKQIVILGIILLIMIILLIINSAREGKPSNELNSKINNTLNTTEDKLIDGLNEQQLDNMKGLMDDNMYEQYKNYFNSENADSEEIMNNSTTVESLMKEGESTDYITNEEQDDLDKEIKEALELYGYDSGLE